MPELTYELALEKIGEAYAVVQVAKREAAEKRAFDLQGLLKKMGPTLGSGLVGAGLGGLAGAGVGGLAGLASGDGFWSGAMRGGALGAGIGGLGGAIAPNASKWLKPVAPGLKPVNPPQAGVGAAGVWTGLGGPKQAVDWAGMGDAALDFAKKNPIPTGAALGALGGGLVGGISSGARGKGFWRGALSGGLAGGALGGGAGAVYQGYDAVTNPPGRYADVRDPKLRAALTAAEDDVARLAPRTGPEMVVDTARDVGTTAAAHFPLSTGVAAARLGYEGGGRALGAFLRPGVDPRLSADPQALAQAIAAKDLGGAAGRLQGVAAGTDPSNLDLGGVVDRVNRTRRVPQWFPRFLGGGAQGRQVIADHEVVPGLEYQAGSPARKITGPPAPQVAVPGRSQPPPGATVETNISEVPSRPQVTAGDVRRLLAEGHRARYQNEMLGGKELPAARGVNLRQGPNGEYYRAPFSLKHPGWLGAHGGALAGDLFWDWLSARRNAMARQDAAVRFEKLRAAAGLPPLPQAQGAQ